jgi:hypothetical protein
VWSGTWNGPGSCPIAFHGPDGGGKLGCDRLAHSENVLVEATVPMGRKPFKLCIQKVPAAGVEAERLPNCPFLSSRYAATSFHMSEVCGVLFFQIFKTSRGLQGQTRTVSSDVPPNA